ncbi:hypothetical protein [Nonomuraea sp. NPDC050643]|uniref:hypothetical protein n=1 Tax=Nonomuraea sp. NPDC050643 TaxID=3155660 RepID=UPI0033C3C910
MARITGAQDLFAHALLEPSLVTTAQVNPDLLKARFAASDADIKRLARIDEAGLARAAHILHGKRRRQLGWILPATRTLLFDDAVGHVVVTDYLDSVLPWRESDEPRQQLAEALRFSAFLQEDVRVSAALAQLTAFEVVRYDVMTRPIITRENANPGRTSSGRLTGGTEIVSFDYDVLAMRSSALSHELPEKWPPAETHIVLHRNDREPIRIFRVEPSVACLLVSYASIPRLADLAAQCEIELVDAERIISQSIAMGMLL